MRACVAAVFTLTVNGWACSSRCSLVKSASSHLRGTLAGVCVSSAKADQCDAAVAAVEQQLGHALSTAPCAPPTTPGVFILSGASGVGKDSVLRRVRYT